MYLDVSLIAADGSIRQRVIACAYLEKIAEPEQWAADNAWNLASQPGWGDAWGYARQNNKTSIGSDNSVISDEQILAAVQLLSAVPPTPDPEPTPPE